MKPWHDRKRTRFKEQFKTLNDVFDLRTEETLWKLITQGYFEGIESPMSIGKEANVFSGITKEGTKVAIKIYRVSTCDFTKMYSILRSDPRCTTLHKNRAKVVYAWAQREYRNLLKVREAGARVPTPLACTNNVLVLEHIGDDAPSPMLKDKLPEDLKKFYEKVAENMAKIHAIKMVHGDLSAFNILNYNDEPVLIDFSQATTTENQHFEEYLERDIRNITAYFVKQGLDVTEEQLAARLRKS